MKKNYSIFKKISVISLMIISLTLTAQTKKILIVQVQDTLFVHSHIGLTAFSNFTDTLKIDFSYSKFIEEKLTKYLENSFETKFISPPKEIRENAIGYWGQSKEFKKWITETQQGYDFLILIYNIDISNELSNAPILKNSNGFYSRGLLHGVYTTIGFDAYQVPNKRLEHYNLGSKVFIQLKDFKMPDDKRTFDDQMLETIKSELIKQIDNRIKYFLTKTYILPNLE